MVSTIPRFNVMSAFIWNLLGVAYVLCLILKGSGSEDGEKHAQMQRKKKWRQGRRISSRLEFNRCTCVLVSIFFSFGILHHEKTIAGLLI